MMAAVDSLDAIETSLRQAVTGDSFASARSLLLQYVAAVEVQMRALPAESDRVRQLQGRTSALFEWTIAMVHSSRDGAARELTQLKTLSGYRPPEAVPPAGIKA
jgi:hypothetical protein